MMGRDESSGPFFLTFRAKALAVAFAKTAPLLASVTKGPRDEAR
jgi:hypothetical protein